MPVDFPSGVSDTTPTFLVGGDAAANTPARATCTTAGLDLLAGASASAQRTSLGLGTAATNATGDFATAAQGTEADTAAQIGIPAAFTTRALAAADNGKNLVCGSAQVATVNTGLASGFGCVFKGIITFAGTATVTDVRTTGATNPWCALCQTGTDTYDCVGTKA